MSLLLALTIAVALNLLLAASLAVVWRGRRLARQEADQARRLYAGRRRHRDWW